MSQRESFERALILLDRMEKRRDAGIRYRWKVMSECPCRVCDRWRRFTTLFPATTEAQQAMHAEIFTDLEGAETDAVYWRMKFQGTWDKPICQRSPLASETEAKP